MLRLWQACSLARFQSKLLTSMTQTEIQRTPLGLLRTLWWREESLQPKANTSTMEADRARMGFLICFPSMEERARDGMTLSPLWEANPLSSQRVSRRAMTSSEAKREWQKPNRSLGWMPQVTYKTYLKMKFKSQKDKNQRQGTNMEVVVRRVTMELTREQRNKIRTY